MKRIASLVALLTLPLLAALVGPAHAQMATTDLVPAAPRLIHPFALGFNTPNIAPENPAALAWGQPSRVAAGMVDGTVTNHLGPSTSDLNGNFLGGRFAGPTFGFAIERQESKQEQSGITFIADTSSELQGSLLLGDVVALGVGMGNYSRDVLGIVTDISRVQYGASVRLAEIYYAGLAAYKDKLETAGLSYERTATVYGIAMRTRGPWQWYLAYDHIDMPDFTPAAPNDGGFKGATLTAQVNASGIVAGVSRASFEPNYAGGGPNEVTSTTVDLGWAPMAGLSISARSSTTDLKDTVGFLTDETTKANSVAVSWLF